MATERGLESNIASDHGLVLAEGSRDPPAHPRVPIRPTLPHPQQSANTGVLATFITRARSEQKVNHFTTKLLSTNFQRKKHLWLITESKEIARTSSETILPHELKECILVMTCPQHEPSVLASLRVQFWGLCFLFYTSLTYPSVKKTVLLICMPMILSCVLRICAPRR